MRANRPRLEGLEGRFLLYATTGMLWPKPKLISYSFVPDGTSIGGVPSDLQQTLNASFPTASWKAQFAKAAAAWQKMANVNFTLVSDNGAPLGVSGNMQNDSRFGDIRIGGYAMSGNILAFAYLPPPANGGTSAGDILFNTSQSWQIDGTTYDLMTVAIHELGHSLGLSHSDTNTAVMWPSYTGSKQVLATDDTSGIRSIYNSRQNDFFDANGSNDIASSADDISSYIGSNAQLTLSALDSTTPIMIGMGDIDWYRITVPASTTGTMVVRMQSAHLSLLSPWLAVYNPGGTTILGSASSTAWGDTVTVTISNVSPGQVYDIKCKGATTGDSGFGAYGLQVNFSSETQPPVTAPNTTMAEQADQGGGTMAESSDSSASGDGTLQDSSAIPGVPTYWVYDDQGSVVSEDTGSVVGPDAGSSSDTTALPDSTLPVDGDVITVGQVSGLGDALMINAGDEARLARGSFEGVPPWTPVWRPNDARATPPPDSSLRVGGAVITIGEASGLGDTLMINAGRNAGWDGSRFEGVLSWTPVWQPHDARATSQAAFAAGRSVFSLFIPLDFSSGNGTGDVLTITIGSVSAGQVHDTLYEGSATVDSGSGTYGHWMQLISQGQPAVAAPDPTMAEPADQGSGTMAESSSGCGSDASAPADSSGDDRGMAVVPTVFESENRKAQGVSDEVVYQALDGWKPDLPE
jgi:hypothetical protein